MTDLAVITIDQEILMRRLISIGANLGESKRFVMHVKPDEQNSVNEEIDALDNLINALFTGEKFDFEKEIDVLKRVVMWHFRFLLRQLDGDQ